MLPASLQSFKSQGRPWFFCQRYDTAVRDDRQDIQCQRKELDAFIEILTKLVDIVDVHKTSIEPAPKRLTHKPLERCPQNLNNLMKSLEMSQGTNDMSKSNLRSLKWSLKSKDVNRAIPGSQLTFTVGGDFNAKLRHYPRHFVIVNFIWWRRW